MTTANARLRNGSSTVISFEQWMTQRSTRGRCPSAPNVRAGKFDSKSGEEGSLGWRQMKGKARSLLVEHDVPGGVRSWSVGKCELDEGGGSEGYHGERERDHDGGGGGDKAIGPWRRQLMTLGLVATPSISRNQLVARAVLCLVARFAASEAAGRIQTVLGDVVLTEAVEA
jgi:hypothetical protein